MFTGALLKVLDQMGLTLERVFKQAAVKVANATNGKQKPWISSSPTGNFYFRPPVKRVTPSNVGRLGNHAAEILFWESIKGSKHISDYEAYLESYPQGIFAPLAHLRIKVYEDQKLASLTPPKAKFVLEPIEADYVALKNANVRGGPDAASAKVATLGKGTKIYVLGKVVSKNWLAVTRGGKRLGYVFSKLLQEGEAYNATGTTPRAKAAKVDENREYWQNYWIENAPGRSATGTTPSAEETLFWNSIKDSGDIFPTNLI